MLILNTIVAMYGIIALSHLFIQLAFGHSHHYFRSNITNADYKPTVAIVVPEYNEDPVLFKKCIQSCLDLDYDRDKYHVYAIDDGSKKKDAINTIKDIKSDLITVIDLKENVGKRKAQKAAFDLINSKDYEIILTLDSDTILDKNAVTNIVFQFVDDKVGAITGNAVVLDKNRNLLTRLISSRYWVAFNLERGSQSLFGTVLCCTGVISAYRTDIIQDLKYRYAFQTFLGKECTYGDDRNLTNLVLSEGYKVVYEENAIGWTDVPKNMKAYLKQQLRWNRSFYRELLITAKMVFEYPTRYPIYMIYDIIMQAFLPPLLLLSLIFVVYRAAYISPFYLLGYLSTLIGIGILRGIYGISRTSDMNFLLFPIYAFIHLFMLIPLRIYAVFTLTAKGWGTR